MRFVPSLHNTNRTGWRFFFGWKTRKDFVAWCSNVKRKSSVILFRFMGIGKLPNLANLVLIMRDSDNLRKHRIESFNIELMQVIWSYFEDYETLNAPWKKLLSFNCYRFQWKKFFSFICDQFEINWEKMGNLAPSAWCITLNLLFTSS